MSALSLQPYYFAAIEQALLDVQGLCLELNMSLACAESCTGGWVAQALTSLHGSSQWFERGFVTYSNEAKLELLGVVPAVLKEHGAVSGEVARQMATGALRHSHALAAVAVTGIAGPEGGDKQKPVGTVWFAWCRHQDQAHSQCVQFSGSRTEIRAQAVAFALRGCVQHLLQG